MRPKPFLLLVLDGWGEANPSPNNAITQAHTPNWDFFMKTYSHGLISGSGEDVGLPDLQMGNSEVGHLNLGAGRIVYQELTKLDRAIKDGSFYKNEKLNEAIEKAQNSGATLHLMGLFSPGGVHSHEDHFFATLRYIATKTQSQLKVAVHAFLDGRDTPPQSAEASLRKLEALLAELNLPPVASVCGRYYAMDRDKRYERTAFAFNLLVHGQCEFTATNAVDALKSAYERGETDEFVKPIRMTTAHIQKGDVVLFMNFRSDRARQMCHALITPEFDGFERRLPEITLYTLTDYSKDLNAHVLYPADSLHNTLGEFIANQGLTQLRIAETEKYAHVTFFFNGGKESTFKGEERILIPSPKVATYDLQPEMSAFEVTEKLVEAIRSQKFDMMICNFANADMVGHSGNLAAAIQAVEALDTCLGKIHAALQEVGGEALITADHGNVEQMFDTVTNQPHTAHTSLPVPLVYLGKRALLDCTDGKLCDVAPTMLTLMGFTPPQEMTGHILLKK